MQEFTRTIPLVTIQGVSKHIGNKVILRDIGREENPFIIYDINRPGKVQGQVVAVVGPSGAGKSTLFEMIAGIHLPTSGSIIIPNEYLNDGSSKEVEPGDIGFVQQAYPLSRNLTVKQMLLDAARQGGIAKKDRLAIVEAMLETWGLIDQRNQSANQLSGGQRQRVAIVEQQLCSHHFILFDEPFSGLDVKNTDDVKNSFEKISESSDLGTVIFSTHDINLAAEIADRIYVLGFEKEKGKRIPGGTLIKFFDLMEMGLAWKPFGAPHREVVAEIHNLIKTC